MSHLKSQHRTMLVELVEAGHGIVDASGRVCVGPIRRPVAGDAVGWLVLMSEGLIAGEDGHVMPTEAGRQAVAQFANGRVRESRGQ